jgi:hypothetical protein
VRDNFSKQTVIEIAKGVGYRCSNPDCSRPTVAANAAQDGTIIIGVAAHICAASPGGPRYDATQLPETRRAKENGLWLCQNCGRLVDADPDTVDARLVPARRGDPGLEIIAVMCPPALCGRPAR